MIPPEGHSRDDNPYAPPLTAVGAPGAIDRPSANGLPKFPWVVVFIRTVGVVHLIVGAYFVVPLLFYIVVFLSVLRGTHSAPWLFRLEYGVLGSYYAALFVSSFAAGYGLIRLRRWARGAEIGFLITYFSFALTAAVMEARRSRAIIVFFVFAAVVVFGSPFVALALNSKCAATLAGSDDPIRE